MVEIKDIECFLLDMDGTFYLGNELLDGSMDFIHTLQKQKKKFVFMTNNSSKNSKNYQEKLKRLGLEVTLKNIVNSGEVTADYIKKQKKDASIYVVGTPSLEEELKDAGLLITKDKRDDIDFLVIGFDTTLDYKKLWDAHDLILRGVEYIATNPDKVCPLPEGKTMPDCGAIIKLLKTSTGKEPLIIGKPNVIMIDYITSFTGVQKDKMAMVGDRLNTDIQAAINAEITSILVLSGVTNREHLKDSKQNPDFVFKSIRELYRKII